MKYQKINKYKYRLHSAEVCQTPILNSPFEHKFFRLDSNGLLTIYEGYMWDGVSGPTWDSRNTMIAGCIHDALYQAIRLEVLPLDYKSIIDDLFHVLLLKENMSELRAGYYYLAVWVFGHYSCVPGSLNTPEVLIA